MGQLKERECCFVLY